MFGLPHPDQSTLCDIIPPGHDADIRNISLLVIVDLVDTSSLPFIKCCLCGIKSVDLKHGLTVTWISQFGCEIDNIVVILKQEIHSLVVTGEIIWISEGQRVQRVIHRSKIIEEV
jgi:hypothetical protein